MIRAATLCKNISYFENAKYHRNFLFVTNNDKSKVDLIL